MTFENTLGPSVFDILSHYTEYFFFFRVRDTGLDHAVGGNLC
jgi:hypothetical protein